MVNLGAGKLRLRAGQRLFHGGALEDTGSHILGRFVWQ